MKPKLNGVCTICGGKDHVSPPVYQWYKGLRLKIQVCRLCAKQVIVQYLNHCFEGTQLTMAINHLTKYDQK